MALIEWRDDFCTGILSIDNEHELLVSLINSTYEKLGSKPPLHNVITFLDIVYSTFSLHFELEEGIMRERGYDQLEAHSEDHRRLLRQLDTIASALKKQKSLDLDALRKTLADWFTGHFSTHDARLEAINSH